MRRASSEQSSIRSSPTFQHRALLEKAWSLPVAKLYAPLLSQSFLSICGPTSVANVLRSMGVDAPKNPLRGFGVRAMSLDQVAVEAAEVVPSEWRVQSMRPESVEALRVELRRANEPSRRFITNFARSSLFGRGSGHHSPIGGYLEEEDLVFVLDVNASFGPWLVSSERLFDAMGTVADWSTGKTRGLVRFELV